ncbi:MAG: carboxypeptidase regulatory-like domain-containing protein [Nevskia sp.]|nr:carboxypeptidase regulatory-like domain-containing protein [Nevskia sp.]
MRSFKHTARRQLLAVLAGGVAAAFPLYTLAADSQLAALDSSGSVQGTVIGNDQKPIAGVRIELSNAAGKIVARTTTDSAGRFSIAGVTPGSYHVTAAKDDDLAAADVEVSGGAASRTALTLGATQLETITVTAQRFERARNQLSPSTGSSRYSFTAKAIEQLPEGDHTSFNHVLLQAPGVANDSFGQVHVRGDHNDLQYRINGIILPDGESGFGQVFDPRFAKSITLNTGALPAEYGLRTAGVVDIVTKDRIDEGDVDAYGGSHDTINPSFQLGKTYGKFSA